jgi:hypothetical protein
MLRRATFPLIAGLLTAATTALPVQAAPPQQIVYVAENGSDDATGTINDPFATIERARDALAGKTSRNRPGVV